MNYMYTLWLRSTNFPKSFRPFQKPRCQKSDIKEVHNLKFRHCLGVEAHMTWKYLQYVCHLTQSCKWLSSLGTLEIQSPHAFWRLYTLKPKTVIMEKKIERNILSVSKSVAWHQKYVHNKACLEMGYTPRAWRQVRWCLYLQMERSSILRQRHIVPLVYCPSCRKWCKNSRPGTSGMKHCGMSPTSTRICLQTRDVHRNRNAPHDYIYTGSSGKQEVTLEFS